MPTIKHHPFTEKHEKIVNDHDKIPSIHGESKKTVNLQPMISLSINNLRGIIAISIVLMTMTIVYIQLNSKEKSEYEKHTGQITYLDKQLGNLPVRHLGKYRYLKIDSYEYPFEMFVGNESGDFKPKFEQIDELKLGDTVTVYYYQTNDVTKKGINRFVQFIDKENVSYFERGNSQKTLGVVMISICVLLLIGGVILWKKKKIEF
jgi:hypothetical protein